MGVKIEEKWRYKKIRKEKASKSAFAFKINRKIKEKSKVSYGSSVNPSFSKEVMVKITGGAKTKQAIKNAVEYISRDWQEEIIDCNGIKYRTKEEMAEAVKVLQENIVYNPMSDLTKDINVTHNMMFSTPRMAEVKREDALNAVSKVLGEKYPDNYFVMAYHEDTQNPHVHVTFNINSGAGTRIDIKAKNFHEIRRDFCKELVENGYDVKATRKYDIRPKEYDELLKRDNRNIYEVVDFGSSPYQLDKRNSKSNYLVYRTLNNKEEVTIWGKGILDEINNNNIKVGDFVKVKKVGETKIKVPTYGKDGTTVEFWKEVKRNQWNIEKASDNSIKIKREYPKEIKLDTPQQAEKQLAQKQRFEHEKKLILDSKYKEKFDLEQKMQHKKKYNLKF